MGRKLGESMSLGSGGLLFGRRTYEDIYAAWRFAREPNPFTEPLNKAPKYVVSNTLSEPLPWINSKLVSGDAPEAVARLKQSSHPARTCA